MKAGFKPKPSSRKQKYVIQGGTHDSRTLPSPGRTPSVGFDSETERPSSLYEDDLSSNSHFFMISLFIISKMILY